MSDEGEKTCPLCAEEMDLTDQQLKPCKCGYEICVWCWHHIMEMAEKNESEGRCPACRTPYDKERIVGTASKCERLVTEISMEKKVKSQKAKTKSSDGRKQLSSVRVIQRNLVYIVGLPLNLADEDLLTGKEYFAQYGKILKVSISRTSAGTIQQFANNSCSVYITYSKEEEAVRCIQSVHGFNLEGRSLRACFGTTKYCHAWLRSVPCTNAECLYLHEIGSTEDSFTKDEVISAYSRVQQITGISNNVQRRAGAVLPAPADDYYSDCSTASTGKPVMKSTTSNVVSNSRVLPTASIANKTGVLPPAASWGTRASNCMSSAGSIVHSNGSTKQKLDTVAGMPLTLTGAATATMKSMDVVRKVKMNEDILSRELKSKLELSENGRKHGSINLRNGALESSNTPLRESAGMVSIGRIPSPSRSLNSSKIKGSFDELANASTVKEKPTASEGKIGKNGKRCSESINSDDQLGSKVHEAGIANTLVYDNSLVSGNKRPQLHCDTEKLQDDLTPSLSEAASSDATTSVDLSGCSGASSGSDIHASARPNLSSETDDFDSQRLSDPIVAIPTNPSLPPNLLNNLLSPSGLHRDAATVVNHNINPPFVHKNADNSLLSSASNPSNGFLDNTIGYSSGIGSSVLLPYGGVEGQLINSNDIDLNTGVDAIENSIISNILSLDLDAWDEPLTSQNLVKLLGESERQQGSLNVANSWRAQSSNQSRFSFARQDSRSQMIDAEPSFNCDVMRTHSFVPTFVENRDPCLDRRMNGFGIPHHNVDSFHSNQSAYSANMPNTSRAQISAPPGFAASSRVPPPGFSSHDRNGQSFDMNSGNNHFGTSSTLRHPYQPSASTNSSLPTDIEFIDPAILAVGKGRVPNGLNNSSLDARSNISPQSMGFESNSGLQLLMQRSLSAQQSQIFGDVLDNGSLHDGYGFTARSLEPSQANNVSPFSQFSLQPRNGVTPNGHYDAWPDVNSGNNTGISDLLRNDRLCFNKFYGGYEDPKFQISSSGDLYNRTFGI